jgi:2-amino-4-hydroxy-6-hydroxymethyldihydropteridine diphosphokinase
LTAVLTPVRAWVGLGANLGDAVAVLARATAEIAGLPQTCVSATSPFYRSAPVDAIGPDFINAVLAIDTDLGAEELLSRMQAIEIRHGRDRGPDAVRNAPRSLDLDLLLYGDRDSTDAQLILPHPRLHRRAFVLRPMLDIDPQLSAPGLGQLADWLPGVADQRIERLDELSGWLPAVLPATRNSAAR